MLSSCGSFWLDDRSSTYDLVGDVLASSVGWLAGTLGRIPYVGAAFELVVGLLDGDTFIDDGDVVAQAFSFFQVMRGQDDGRAFGVLLF